MNNCQYLQFIGDHPYLTVILTIVVLQFLYATIVHSIRGHSSDD